MVGSPIAVGRSAYGFGRARRFVCRALLAATLAAADLAAPVPCRAGEQKAPNIVLIVADDLAAWATGLSGRPEIAIPTLDALAAGGLRMTNAAGPTPAPQR